MLIDEIRKRTEEKVTYHKQDEERKQDILKTIQVMVDEIRKFADLGKHELTVTLLENDERPITKHFQEQGFKTNIKLDLSKEYLRHLTISW